MYYFSLARQPLCFKIIILLVNASASIGFVSRSFVVNNNKHCVVGRPLEAMKRPFLDQLASSLFRLEMDRVEKSSVKDEKGRDGEPMEWSERESFANQFSEFIASNDIGYFFKQFVADIVAGEFEEKTVESEIDVFVQDNPVAVFSFSTCPFCRRAKDYFEENGIPYKSLELDELEGNRGNEIRAILGRKTKRTSVPSIFIGQNYIGGCNDGPGLLPLAETGKLKELLMEARVPVAK